jgi:hypothetical protein
MENLELSKNCPLCNKSIYYKRKGDLQQAKKHNTKCKQCVSDLRIYGKNEKNYKRNCPKCKNIIFYSNLKFRNRSEKLGKCCRSCSSPFKDKKNIKLSESFDLVYSDKRKLKNCKTCNKGFIVTKGGEDRIYCCFKCYINDDNILKGKFLPSFNKKACEYFDEINKYKGWSGIHGLNEGEKKIKKYWVDYYEPNLNIVIEWDEKVHNTPKQKEKDLKRQQEIINHINCDFYRIEEKTGKIIKINKNGTIEEKEKNYWFK